MKQNLSDKPYKIHLHPQCLALDTSEMSLDEPKLLTDLRQLIHETLTAQKLIGFDIPVLWIEFSHIIDRLRQRNIFFADINQIHEVARSRISEIDSYEKLIAVLHFYHNQGKIFCLDYNAMFSYDAQSCNETGIIVLDPIWFVNQVYKLATAVKNTHDDGFNSPQNGILKEEIVKQMLSDCNEQELVLLGCLEKLDILCELRPYIPIEDPPDVAVSAMLPKIYFFPWVAQCTPETEQCSNETETSSDTSLQLAIDFNGVLPVGLFSRFLVRLSRWSWNQGWGRRPEMYNLEARIAVDFDHDLLLKVSTQYSRIFLMIVKMYEGMQSDQNEPFFPGPTSNVCVKVNNHYRTINRALFSHAEHF